MALIRSSHTRGTVARIAVIPDIHAPHTDPDAWKWALEKVRKCKPSHVVQIGDWPDTSAVSTHYNEDEHSQYEEYCKVAQQSKDIRKAAPNATLIHLEGNHEDRFSPDKMNVPKRLRDFLHWRNHKDLGPEWRAWRHVPFVKGKRGCVRIGGVLFYHGWDCTSNSDELEAIQMAGEMGAEPGLLCVRGHTHRPVAPTQCMRTKTVGLPWWYMNVGHLGPKQPDWMRTGDVSRWGHAIATIETPTSGRGGPRWDATLHVRGTDHGRMGMAYTCTGGGHQ